MTSTWMARCAEAMNLCTDALRAKKDVDGLFR
jgi:hypothetical protein